MIVAGPIGRLVDGPSRREVIAKWPEHGRRPYNDPNKRPLVRQRCGEPSESGYPRSNEELHMARARNPSVLGVVWGLVWGVVAAVGLHEIGLAAIFVGVLAGVVMGVLIGFAYARGNQYRD
jgi:hypothetical protein